MENRALPPREPHLSETTENYLKRIYILLKSRGNARISEIAKLMNRSLSSVSEAVKRMADEGYLSYEKYGKINLTERGLKIAETVGSLVIPQPSKIIKSTFLFIGTNCAIKVRKILGVLSFFDILIQDRLHVEITAKEKGDFCHHCFLERSSLPSASGCTNTNDHKLCTFENRDTSHA